MDYGDTQRRAEFWWDAPKDAVGMAVIRMADSIVNQQRAQREDTRFYMDLCSNSNTAGNDTYALLSNGKRWGWDRKMRQNICAAGVDTASSLIAQNRTAPMYLTSLGDFTLSRKAEQRSRVLHSQFYDLGVYRYMPEAWRDCGEAGTGHLFGCVRNGLPHVERCLPNEVLVEDMDGRYRSPRSMYRVHFVAREQLRKLYKDAKGIDESGGPSAHDYIDFNLRTDSCVDRVRVIEAWHLPSVKGGDDGRHIVCTDKVVLRDEPWTRERFPFVRVAYMERRIGYYGQGLAERLAGAQIQLNELNDTIRDCQRLVSNILIWMDENDDGAWEDLTNMPGQIIRSRTPPQLLRWEGTPGDLFRERQVIKEDAFDQEGLSAPMISGDGASPGVSSGRAIRAEDDVRSRRHIDPTRRLEYAYLDVTQLISDLNDECAELDPEYVVTGRARFGRQTFLRTSKWKELELPDGDVRVNMFPMAALPTTVQGKFAAVDEWIQGGFVSRPQALDLMEFPDIDAWQQLENANIDLVRWQIERLLDLAEGEPGELPIENQDIPMAVKFINQAFLVAYRMQAPAHVQLAFQTYLAYAKQLTDKLAAEEAAQAAPPPEAMGPAALDQNAAAAAQLAAPPAGGMAA